MFFSHKGKIFGAQLYFVSFIYLFFHVLYLEDNFFLSFFKNIYLFIWLHCILVAAYGLFGAAIQRHVGS